MKKPIIISIFVVVMMAIGVWLILPSSQCQGASCGQQTTNQNTTKATSTSITEVARQAAQKSEQGTAYLFDVRTAQEFTSGHVKQATNFDVETIKAGQVPSVPKDAEIYVYCRSGNRSNEATKLLTAQGFTNVTDLGGLDTMRSAGLL